MIELKPSYENALKKFDTARKIKELVKKKIVPAVEGKLDLKDIIYKRVSISELFN